MKQIVVAQSGWVFIGETQQLADVMRITDASVIRVWGTSNGLGEIAINGPTKHTTLDYAGIVEIKTHAVLFTVDCTYDDR